MQITLFSGFSKEANSTKQPSGGTAISCFLKDNTSVIHPVFILDRTDFSINYVQWGSRYYFVDDIVSIRNTTIELHCTVDPMATYKTAIGGSSQYVTRAAGAYDPYILDALYPAENRVNVSSTSLSGIGIVGTGSYVMGVVNDKGTGVRFYNLTASVFEQLMTFMFTGLWLDAPLTEISLQLQRELVNPFQYIVSIQWFPFSIGGTTEEISFGYWDSGIYAEYIGDSIRNQFFSTTITVPRHNQAAARGKYLNGSPYTRHMMNFYTWGSFPIDPVYFVDDGTCAIVVNIDTYTGIGKLAVSDPSGINIFSGVAQCGVPIQISQVTQNLLGAGLSVIGTVASVATGNALGIASNIANAIHSMLPQLSTAGAQGSNAGWQALPTLVSTFYQLTSEDNEHNGRPLMQRKTINTLSGYIQVENPDVDIVGTTYEKDMITSYMRSGFYYE